MSIICKRGVSLDDCGPEILRALIAIDPLYDKHGLNTVVTSGSEKHQKHSAHRSAHYRGDAADTRSKSLPEEERPKMLSKIKRKLGLDFVVILENKGQPNEHFHIHWSPVFGGEG